MASLVIDIGNSYTKIAIFEQGEMIYNMQHRVMDSGVIAVLLNDYKIKKAIISSVKKGGTEEWETLVADKVGVIHFNNTMTCTIINHYLTPETLGADRLAAVIGAHALYPGSDNLVIDGGTCITYDYVDAAGNYFGGSISPGLKMRYKALNHYTSGLPLIDADEDFTGNYGNSTATAILSGIQNGIKYELSGFINSYKKGAENPNIVLCGGDSIFFDTLLKNSIFAPYIKNEPYLVLKGLNAAIHYYND